MQIEPEHNRKEQKSKNVRIESNNLKEQNKTDQIIRTCRIQLRRVKQNRTKQMKAEYN